MPLSLQIVNSQNDLLATKFLYIAGGIKMTPQDNHILNVWYIRMYVYINNLWIGYEYVYNDIFEVRAGNTHNAIICVKLA